MAHSFVKIVTIKNGGLEVPFIIKAAEVYANAGMGFPISRQCKFFLKISCVCERNSFLAAMEQQVCNAICGNRLTRSPLRSFSQSFTRKK